MSKLMNLDILTDRYKDDHFKQKEIVKFQMTFPGAKVVRDDYTSELELEDDWAGYCSLPYSLKVLCNERCLRLYGKKNEEQYLEQKKIFMRKDINHTSLGSQDIYRPRGLSEGENVDMEFLNKQAQEYMDHGGYSILRTDFDNLYDMNRAYYDFQNQCIEYKRIANDKSRELFGYSVPEVYQREVHKFLLQDIKDSDYGSSFHPVVNDSLSATEAVLDALLKSPLDPIEGALLTEAARMQAQTPVEESLVDMMEEICMANRSGTANTMESTFGLVGYNPQFLLPWEVMNLSEDKEALMEDPMFLNFYARNLGFKPPMKSYREEARVILEAHEDKEKMIRIGWNPVIPFNEENMERGVARANKALAEQLNYKIIDFSLMQPLLNESDEVLDKKPKGLSVMIIKPLRKDDPEYLEELPKVLVTTNQDDPMWWVLQYGQLAYKQSVDSVLKMYKDAWPSVSNYFLQVSDDVYDTLDEKIKNFNQDNELQRVCMALQTPSPFIANSGLLAMKLLDALLYNKDDGTKKTNSPTVIHLLYSASDEEVSPIWKHVHESYSKLNIYRQFTELSESFLYEGLSVQLESLQEEKVVKEDLFFTNQWKDYKGLFKTPIQSLV